MCLDEWIKKMWYAHTSWNIIQLQKENLPFETAGMDLEGILLSEISQTEKNKCCIRSLIYGI